MILSPEFLLGAVQIVPLLLGTAEIGQGSFGWRPANKQKFKRIEWDKLGAPLSTRLDGRVAGASERAGGFCRKPH